MISAAAMTTDVHGLDPETCYRALEAHDTRFDGVFFTAVSTTGIYCRPICPARVPAARNCRFFATAAQAEAAGFRACFRCRPELAPANLGFLAPAADEAPGASVDAVRRLVLLASRRIEAGYLNTASVDDLAAELGVTSRHLRRSMEALLGVSPVELAQTKRLSLAKHLLHDTQLPLAQIAFASGFASVRRFNALFQARFGRAPSALRREQTPTQRASPSSLAPAEATTGARAGLSLRLDYRPPLAWDALLEFLALRAIPGVESVAQGSYRRTALLDGKAGWIAVRLDTASASRNALAVTVSLSLAQVLPQVVAAVRHLFDLDAQPALIDAHLARDPRLRPLVEGRPGLRVPGAFDGFELAVRAIVGQQISVAATATLLGRIARRFGEPLSPNGSDVPMDDGEHQRWIFPSASTLAVVAPTALAEVGMPASRAHAIVSLAAAVARGRVHFGRTGPATMDIQPARTAWAGAPGAVADLANLPGIGRWTAEYIGLRGLHDPNAFPASDLGVRKALGNVTAQAAEAMARAWQPWRGYAVMHLWRSLNGPPQPHRLRFGLSLRQGRTQS